MGEPTGFARPGLDASATLALTLHARPGSTAVLAGAGLSVAAGVPAAWEIQQSLLRDAATASREEHEDVFAWWYERTGEQARYDDILYATAPTPSARMNLLRPMFEPTPDEGDAGIKVPGPAHRALAALMAAGHIRIIVTLNFDLLIETALRELGIEPTVISSADDVAGMEPLHAQTHLVWHLHGNYTNPGMLNTPDELRTYPAVVNARLDELIDQYGMLVIGWSATWDPALVAAMRRSPARRYPTFWLDVAQLSQTAGALATGRDALVVTADAGTWLTEVTDATSALTDRVTDPVTIAGAVAAAKRELSLHTSAVSTHDRLEREIDRLEGLDVLSRDERVFFTLGYAQRLPVLLPELEMWTALTAALAYWGTPQTDGWWLPHLARFAEPARLSGLTDAIYSLAAPAVTALYAAGTAALAAGRWSLVARLLLGSRVNDRHLAATAPACLIIGPLDVFSSVTWPSRALFEYLAPQLVEPVGLASATVRECFEAFEFLVFASAIDRGGREPGVYPPVAVPYARVDDDYGRGRRGLAVLARRWLERSTGLPELIDRVFEGDGQRAEEAFGEVERRITEAVVNAENRAMPAGRAVVMPSGVRYPPL